MEKRIARILFEERDPLKVKDQAPADEYAEYAQVIENMLRQGKGRREVCEYLERTRSSILHAPTDYLADGRAAQAIFASAMS